MKSWELRVKTHIVFICTKMHKMFPFAFLSPYSAYFGLLSNFLARFSRLALRLLLLAFISRSVSKCTKCSLLRSSRLILPILVSSLTFLRVFLDSLYVFYFLLLSVALSLSFQPIFTQNPLSTNLNYNSFLPLTKLWLCRYCYFASWLDIAKYWELLFNYNLTSLTSLSKHRLQIICFRGFTFPSPGEALVYVIPNRVPAISCIRA